MSNSPHHSRQPPPRSKPPLWALGFAILVGAAAALLSPFGHAHEEGGGVYLHSHGWAGPHSHGPESAGEPLPAEEGEQDSRILALPFAAHLDVGAPALAPAAESSPRPAEPLPPSLPRTAGHVTPWSPRGPPALPC